MQPLVLVDERTDPSQLRARGQASAVRVTFEQAYAAHVRFVWNVLRGLGVPDPQVEDAVQDVFVVVHRRLAEFDGAHSIRGWLFQIARRVAHDYRRAQRRIIQEKPLSDDVPDRGHCPAAAAEHAESLRLLETMLAELDEGKREVLVLSELGELTVPEIAEATGANLNTVYTRLNRARKAFNEALARRGGMDR